MKGLIVVIVIIGILAMINMKSSNEELLIADNPMASVNQKSAIVDLANQALSKENMSITQSGKLIKKINEENIKNLGGMKLSPILDAAKKNISQE